MVGGNAQHHVLIACHVCGGFDQKAASAVRSCGQLCSVCACIILCGQAVKADHRGDGVCTVEYDLNGIGGRFGFGLRLGIRAGIGFGLGFRLGIRAGIGRYLLIQANVRSRTFLGSEECDGIHVHHSTALSVQPRIEANIRTVTRVKAVRTVLNAIHSTAVIQHDRDPFILGSVSDVLVGVHTAGNNIIIGTAGCHKEYAVTALIANLDAQRNVRILGHLGNCIKGDQEIRSAVHSAFNHHCILGRIKGKLYAISCFNAFNGELIKFNHMLGIRLGVLGRAIRTGIAALLFLDLNTAICCSCSLCLEKCDRVDIHDRACIDRVPGIETNVRGIAVIHGISAILDAIVGTRIIQNDCLPILGKGIHQRLIGIHTILENIVARAGACHKEHTGAFQA